MQLISWNVNGIRAAIRKGFTEWFTDTRPDILALQETRATAKQIPDTIRNAEGYHTHWLSATSKKGYSGVGLLTREKPLSIQEGLGIEKFDVEGRVLIAEYETFILINAYFPSGTSGQERVDYKLEFNDVFLQKAEELRQQKPVIFCGDVNTAHQAIDLARPGSNEKNSGFLPIERAWIDQVVDKGYVDTFRYLYPDAKDNYSWWTMRGTARERNVGWRIDYVFMVEDLLPRLADAFILAEVEGSDHCPVGIKLKPDS